jgi:hypothetical protein
MQTGEGLFKLYHFAPPSPTGSTAQHPCEFMARGISDIAAPRIKSLIADILVALSDIRFRG